MGASLSTMFSFHQTITPDSEVLAILVHCTEFACLEDGRAQVRVDQRLEPALADRTEKLLRDLGAQWDRHASCMVLPAGVNPERLIDQLLQVGSVTLTASVELSV